MKTTSLILSSLIASLPLSQLSSAQDINSALTNVASKINTDGEYISMTRLDGDIGAIKQYLDVILSVARDNGENIPTGLNAKELFRITGLDKLKAVGSSAKELDNAWINHSYLENGGNKSGVFSFIGQPNQKHVAANIFPSGTDIALQLQVDTQELAPMLEQLSEISDKKKYNQEIHKTIPELDMSPAEIMAKMQVTLSLALDLDTTDAANKGPLQALTNANAIMRIDGLTWLWDKIGNKIIEKSEIPFEKKEDATAKVITYSVPDDMQVKLMGYSPQLIIDKTNDHIWITTSAAFYEKSIAGEHKLADSAEFKAAMEGLPNTANSMLYLSKGLLITAQTQYEFAARNKLFGADFTKGKKVVDRLMEDITESDKGWAMVLNKDETGVMLANRGPVGLQHLNYLQNIIPLLTIGRMHQQHLEPSEE